MPGETTASPTSPGASWTRSWPDRGPDRPGSRRNRAGVDGGESRSSPRGPWTMPRPAYTRSHAPGGYLLLAVWTVLLLGPGPAPAQNQPSPQEEELRRQLRIERTARKALAYQADMRRAALLAEAEEWPALRDVLDGYRPAAGEADLRGWEWHFLDSLARKTQLVDRRESVFQGPGAGIHQLAWSGNGERLAAVGEDGEVLL